MEGSGNSMDGLGPLAKLTEELLVVGGETLNSKYIQRLAGGGVGGHQYYPAGLPLHSFQLVIPC